MQIDILQNVSAAYFEGQVNEWMVCLELNDASLSWVI